VREPDVASVMTTQVITAKPDTPFKDVVRVMADQAISAVPVVDEQNRPIGVVSEADVLAKQEFHGGEDEQPHGDPAGRDRWYRALARTAGELMTAPVRTVPAGEPLSVAARMLAREKVRRMFVVDDGGRIVGVVSRRDLLGIYLHTDEELRASIEELLSSPAVGLPKDTVGISVHNGTATVDGVLTKRRQAEVVARAVLAMPGVVAVQNNLRYVVDDLAGRSTIRAADFRP
jgi:CBS domain-containing protein